jgi:hypothetical protein
MTKFDTLNTLSKKEPVSGMTTVTFKPTKSINKRNMFPVIINVTAKREENQQMTDDLG